MTSPLLLTGISLQPAQYAELLSKRPPLAWVEISSESLCHAHGDRLEIIEQIKQHYPVSLHGINMSLGSTDELNWHYLKKIRDLSTHIEPCLISDHLAWSSINGQYFDALLPLPYTTEMVDAVCQRIDEVQQFLGRQILIENIAHYVNFKESTMPEWEFLNAVSSRSSCGILLNVSNIYINATNLGFNPNAYLSALASSSVQEIHLGGFSTQESSTKELLLDTNNRAIVPAVWDLYRQTLQHLGTKPTIITWDSNQPSLETLYLEAFRAEKITRDLYATTKLAS